MGVPVVPSTSVLCCQREPWSTSGPGPATCCPGIWESQDGTSSAVHACSPGAGTHLSRRPRLFLLKLAVLPACSSSLAKRCGSAERASQGSHPAQTRPRLCMQPGPCSPPAPTTSRPCKLCLSPLCALGLNASRDSLFPLHRNHLDVCVVSSDFSSTPFLLPRQELHASPPTLPAREGTATPAEE